MSLEPAQPGWALPAPDRRKHVVTIRGEQRVLGLEVLAARAGVTLSEAANRLLSAAIDEQIIDEDVARMMRDVKRFRRGIAVVTTDSVPGDNSPPADVPGST